MLFDILGEIQEDVITHESIDRLVSAAENVSESVTAINEMLEYKYQDLLDLLDLYAQNRQSPSAKAGGMFMLAVIYSNVRGKDLWTEWFYDTLEQIDRSVAHMILNQYYTESSAAYELIGQRCPKWLTFADLVSQHFNNDAFGAGALFVLHALHEAEVFAGMDRETGEEEFEEFEQDDDWPELIGV